MNDLLTNLVETNLVVAKTQTGLIVRGGPGVASATRGDWSVVVDDLGTDRATPARLERFLDCVERDPLDAVMRHFGEPSLELFVIVGPPGVIMGSAPSVHRERVVVWADPRDGVAAVGRGGVRLPSDWLSLKAGTAVCWGPDGPEAVCYIGRHSVEAWSPFELRVAV